MTKLGTEKSTTRHASIHPTLKDLYWAAGLLEGEGCFAFSGTEAAVCSMTDKEPIEHLLALFGGSLYEIPMDKYYQKAKVVWRWQVTGSRARGVMMTLYALLSPRRQEAIRKCLKA